MATPSDLLPLIEAQLQQLQAALLSSDPLALEQGAQTLREAAAALVQLRGQGLDGAAQQRLQALALQLSQVRDQLARVLALTQQRAVALLPPAESFTYGPASATPARIYRAPG
ncbi:hypothetical protein GCM10027019_28860 [Melaminivora jejuensis]|uniref:hypothetical protein n=1 Tax=Melaminivora jejuensis TaxID=1267217 RepID=UPI001ADF75E4|nr:hypothetical protein [Melaminivora jejuensis]UHJ64641.1 hypothetical protein LVC68_15050 [Melaminivora jejuensis]